MLTNSNSHLRQLFTVSLSVSAAVQLSSDRLLKTVMNNKRAVHRQAAPVVIANMAFNTLT